MAEDIEHPFSVADLRRLLLYSDHNDGETGAAARRLTIALHKFEATTRIDTLTEGGKRIMRAIQGGVEVGRRELRDDVEVRARMEGGETRYWFVSPGASEKLLDMTRGTTAEEVVRWLKRGED